MMRWLASTAKSTSAASPDKTAAKQCLLSADRFLKESRFQDARTEIEKAKKFDELSSLIQASGILAGGGDSNVIVNGHANNVVVNPDTKRLIEEIMQKDKEERDMILRILELEKDEKEKLLELYAVINKGESIPKGKKKPSSSKSK